MEPEPYKPTRKAVTPPPVIRKPPKPPRKQTSPQKTERNTYTSAEKFSNTGELSNRFTFRQASPESFKFHLTTV